MPANRTSHRVRARGQSDARRPRDRPERSLTSPRDLPDRAPRSPRDRPVAPRSQVLSADPDAALFGEAAGDGFNEDISDDALLAMEMPISDARSATPLPANAASAAPLPPPPIGGRRPASGGKISRVHTRRRHLCHAWPWVCGCVVWRRAVRRIHSSCNSPKSGRRLHLAG